MGKIVMPKNSALLNEIESVLDIYYHNNGWMPNEDYKTKLKDMIGDDQYSSSYTKKAQITSYFGFTEWEDIHNPQSRRRITESGRKMYDALQSGNTTAVQDVLMTALETVKFGRNNFGCPESDSDVEPPALFIRAILDMGYLTYREFAFLLWKLEDLGANYTDALKELRNLRSRGTVDIGEEANKYVDCKPIMILVRWGFLAEDENSSTGGKHIIIEPEVLNRFEIRLRNLKIYNVDMDIADPIKDDYSISSDEVTMPPIDESRRLHGGVNVLLYGVPGCGKSHTIKNRYCKDADGIERVVFHPDYTYGDFVGQIMPLTGDGGRIRYEFSAGPFTRILSDAYNNPKKKYCLVVEEINRGNAPAIFGDIFQLLDREEDGSGSYEITNVDVAEKMYIYNKASVSDPSKIKLPSNLFIYATMNTSDQNVFTLDTAFQRRWNMRMVENDVTKATKIADKPILDTTIKWAEFNQIINELILSKNVGMASSEDKRLGAYFVTENDLYYYTKADGITQEEADDRNHNFPEKVLKYLWDDAFKFTRDEVFQSSYDSLEKLIKAFETAKGDKRFSIFLNDIFELDQGE